MWREEVCEVDGIFSDRLALAFACLTRSGDSLELWIAGYSIVDFD